MKINYSVKLLLEKQPDKVKKTQLYKNLVLNIQQDEILKLRLKRKIYNDLYKCRIEPDLLKKYLITNKLPLHPFFPRFLLIRKKYIEQRAIVKKNRKDAIDSIMKTIPSQIKTFLRFLLEYERKLSGYKPAIFIHFFVPTTLKKARFLKNYSIFEWYDYCGTYKTALAKKYLRTDLSFLEYILSKMVLGFTPDERLDTKIINKSYRNLSLIYHPDKGGNSDHFKIISECKTILNESIRYNT